MSSDQPPESLPVLENTSELPPAELPPESAVALELALWESVKDGTPGELESYLERYPDGTFASLARTRLEEGTQSAETTGPGDAGANALDLAFWESVKDSNRREELQVYLEKHPDGHFAGLARARLASIEKELESGNASALEGRPSNAEEIKGANSDRL